MCDVITVLRIITPCLYRLINLLLWTAWTQYFLVLMKSPGRKAEYVRQSARHREKTAVKTRAEAIINQRNRRLVPSTNIKLNNFLIIGQAVSDLKLNQQSSKPFKDTRQSVGWPTDSGSYGSLDTVAWQNSIITLPFRAQRWQMLCSVEWFGIWERLLLYNLLLLLLSPPATVHAAINGPLVPRWSVI